jgi:hypothetical protein
MSFDHVFAQPFPVQIEPAKPANPPGVDETAACDKPPVETERPPQPKPESN